MTTLYGISNCDTIKKARKWLEENNIAYTYHDFRRDGIEKNTIEQWCQQVDWQILLNRRGTTWRKLDPVIQQQVDRDNVAQLLTDHPAMIKRPVLVHHNTLTVGFTADDYQTLFANS